MNDFAMMMAKKAIMGIVEDLFTEENIREYGDHLFDFAEDAVVSSKTQIDDFFVLPIIKQLRKTLNIPDRPDD